MLVYNYNKDTKQYTYSTNAYKDPMQQNQYLLPANATFTQPPQKKENYAIIYENNQWKYVEDYRGKTIWLNDQISQVCDYIGKLKDGWSLIKPKKILNIEDVYGVIYKYKSLKAYGGIIVNYNNYNYNFSTDLKSITLLKQAIDLMNTNESINWKCYIDNKPIFILLTKIQLEQIYIFGKQFIENCFNIEHNLTSYYENIDRIELLNQDEIKQNINNSFNNVSNILSL